MVRFPAGGSLTSGATPGNSQPTYLGASTDPNTGVVITRIADQTAFSAAGTQFLRNPYSKRQSWNEDGGKILLNYTSPNVMLDGNTYAILNNNVGVPSSFLWSNTDPRYGYGITSGRILVKNDLIANNGATRSTVRDFASTLAAGGTVTQMEIGVGEGCQSNDDRYWPLLYTQNGGTSYRMVVYDMVADTPGTPLTGIPNYDWVGMSQDGAYVVVNWGQEGSGTFQGMKAYPRANFTTGAAIHLTNGVEHADLGVSRAGDQVLVTINYLDAIGARIEMIRLADAAKTVILAEPPTYIQGHISCRNLKRPGWAYFSSNSDSDSSNPGFDKVVALELKAGGTVQTFCHMHHNPANRNTDGNQPKASPNRDGSRVVFGSDWGGNASAPVYAYVAELIREDAKGPLGPWY